MSPPKKRMRMKGPDKEAKDAKIPSMPADKQQPSLTDVNALFGGLLEQIQAISSPSDKANLQPIYSSMLTLKKWQRELFDKLDDSNQALETARAAHKKQQDALAALQYERAHLEQRLRDCQNYTTPHLAKLARDQQQQEEEEGSDDATKKNDDQAMADFLQANVNDPADKQKIIARLHRELNMRGGLERDLKLKQEQLQKLQEEYKTKSAFLQSLPEHLTSIERASLPLQRFMTTNAASGQGQQKSIRMIGTERSQRLELAKSLPSPLYTLFEQLQQHVDQNVIVESNDNGSNNNSMSLGIMGEQQQDKKQVLLQLPVPDVAATARSGSGSAGRPKRVTIHFRCCDEPAVMVTASATGCATSLNQECLLDELFPNDSPDPISTVTGRPYHWCNYVAGLYLVSADCQLTSTRVIVRELQRRIRANATLKHILQSLQRKNVPEPARDEESLSSSGQLSCSCQSSCKLVSFALDKKGSDDDKSTEKTYAVTLRSSGQSNSSLTARVVLHMSRYPAVPPTWKLLNATNEPNPLYDDHLAALEQNVNVELLDRMIAQADNDKKDESSLEWILVYQLREIMRQWDSMLKDEGNQESAASRTHKGRDRAPVQNSSS